MDWTQHPNIPHVVYASSQPYGNLMLHFACNLCGARLDVKCTGHRGMPLWRLNDFANQHSHGRFGRIPNPKPR